MGSGTAPLVPEPGTKSTLAVSSGTLTLSGTTAFTINNTGPALAPGTYPIISTSGAGAVGGVAPASVNVLGGGLSGSATASLQISGGTLNLVVVNPVPPTPTILPVYRDGLGNIVIRTETTVGFDYLLLSTTSLTPPVIWITNSTTAGTGGTITNAVPILQAPPKQFFRYIVD